MELATLLTLYPVAKTLMRDAPEVAKWLERKAKREDPQVFFQLQSLEILSRLESRFDDLRRYTLQTSIMSAMLANPDLDRSKVKEKFLEAGEVAGDIIDTLERVNP